MKRSAAAFLALAVGYSAMACSPVLPGYTAALSRWTETSYVYRETELQASLRATLKSRDFRRHYVREMARMFSLPADERKALLTAELKAEAEAYVFVLVFSTKEPAWNELGVDQKIWRLRLANRRGHSLAPQQVRPLSRDNPTWQFLFHRGQRHHRIWEVTFSRKTPDGSPLVAPGQHLDLVLAGAPAQFKLTWKAP